MKYPWQLEAWHTRHVSGLKLTPLYNSTCTTNDNRQFNPTFEEHEALHGLRFLSGCDRCFFALPLWFDPGRWRRESGHFRQRPPGGKRSTGPTVWPQGTASYPLTDMARSSSVCVCVYPRRAGFVGICWDLKRAVVNKSSFDRSAAGCPVEVPFLAGKQGLKDSYSSSCVS